ncbi:MAG TPA: antibiotic biosynthesis monooxygenase [Xanthobacteraceae bacterium]|nr:antibiotic biosynthesis monooxygenase [Xanthobacteraceae bacterium]
MIARIWRGQATADNAPRYEAHATRHVFPSLAALPGHRGAYLLTRQTKGDVEFLAVTLWESIEFVKAFAGDDPEVAVVEPEARAVLSDFDGFARHYEIADAAAFGVASR